MNRIILAASLAAFPSALCAQTCLGGASFAHRRALIGSDVSSATGARSASVGLGIGSQAGPFALVGYGRAHDDALADDAILFSGTVGVGFGLRAKPTTQFCPIFSARALNGALLPSGESVSSQSFGLGVSIGTLLGVTPDVAFVPFVSGATVTETATINRFSGVVVAETERHTELSLGLGLVFAKMLNIRPSATFAMHEGQTSRTLGVRLSYSFGAVRRATVVKGPGSNATVWLDPRSKLYYCQGSRMYGGTMYGSFTTEREAIASGATPENGKRC